MGKQILSEEEVNGHIDSAFEIALYIRRNVVQGKQKEDGNFGESSVTFSVGSVSHGDECCIRRMEARLLRS